MSHFMGTVYYAAWIPLELRPTPYKIGPYVSLFEITVHQRSLDTNGFQVKISILQIYKIMEVCQGRNYPKKQPKQLKEIY